MKLEMTGSKLGRSMRLGTMALMLGAGLGLTACDSTTGGSTGHLTLLLTDAPGDMQSAWVTIEEIYLQGGSDEEVEDGEDNGRITLFDGPLTVDLLTLANEVETLVEGVEVPAGSYGQLRVIVSGGCVTVEGSTESEMLVYASQGYMECGAANGSLQMPSFAQTGIKVLLPGDDGFTVTGGQTILLLDFDVAQSFGHAAGASGSWVMTPVIKGSEIELTASITVNLSAGDDVTFPTVEGEVVGLGDFEADLSTEEANVVFTDEDGDGVFSATFHHLVVDPLTEFDVSVVAPAGVTATLDPAGPVSATIASGQDTEVDFLLTELSAN